MSGAKPLSAIFWNSASIAPVSPMWAAMALATPPSARMPATTASQASCLRLETITCAPKDASRRAVASPMPREAPVTMAVLPVRSNSFGSMAGPYGKGCGGGAASAYNRTRMITADAQA